MAATAELELSDAQAKKIVKLAIENGAYSDDMPDDKKGRLAAAREAVEFCIDSWVNDGVRPDDDDEDIAAAGEAIVSIFEAAGIETDDEGNILTGEAEDEDEDDEPESDDDDEEAFNPNDYIEGWSELSPASKVKALKDLDLDDEDTVGVIESIKEWEEAQKKPSSRVLSWIEDNLGDDEGEDEDADDDEDGEPDPEDDTDDAMEEPWEGYDKQAAVDIKKALDEEMESGLEADQLEYVKEYEEARDRPRKRVLDHVELLLSKLEDSDDDSEDDDDEDEPPKKALAKGKAKKAAASNGAVVILTREQILTALDSGEVRIDI